MIERAATATRLSMSDRASRAGTAAKRRKNAAHGASRGGVHGKRRKLRRGARNMSHASGNILFHMIFSAQGRRRLIKPDFRADHFAYLGGIIREMHGAALIIQALSA
jgi:hypothetical protein